VKYVNSSRKKTKVNLFVAIYIKKMELKKIPANTPRYDAKDFIGKHAFGEDKQLYKSNENGRWVLAN
jgi:hypothetical protein